MLYVRFPLSLRNVEDLLHERGVEITVPLISPCGVICVLDEGQRHCARL
jgi:transposase-like protein